MMMQLEQEQLLKAQQNPEDFQKIYEQHYCGVFNQVEKRIHNEEVSANITQQVFLKTIKDVNKYNRNEHSLSTRLYRTVVNKCAIFFKSSSNKRHIVVNEQIANKLLDEIGILRCYEGKTQKLSKALELLTIQEIELLELKFIENKIFQEQGYIMNMSENTAKLKTYSLLNKIKRLMRSDSAEPKAIKKVEIADIEHETPQEKIKSYMSFDCLWKEFKSSKVTALQILREATSYVEGSVLKRAFVSFGFILLFGLFASYYLPDKPKTTEIEVQPEIYIRELNLDKANQMDIAYSTDLACLNV